MQKPKYSKPSVVSMDSVASVLGNTCIDNGINPNTILSCLPSGGLANGPCSTGTEAGVVTGNCQDGGKAGYGTSSGNCETGTIAKIYCGTGGQAAYG